VAMQINGKKITFPTGKGGELYFENIISSEQPEFKDCSYMDKEDDSFVIKPGKYKATFDYRGKICSLDIVIPESDEMIVDLGDIECDIISSSPPQLSE
jgi:hypothetical protein